MLGRPILSRDQLAAHRVGVAGQNDVIWAPLYDFQAYPSAGSLSLTFFSTPIGQGTTSAPNGGTGAKTRADTNLTVQGQLTKGNEFYATGLETLFYPGVNNSTSTPFGINPGRGSVALANVGQFVNDIWQVGNSGLVTLQVGTDRNYVQDGPLMMFPPVTRLALAAAISNTFDSDSTATAVVEEISYAVWSGEPYTLVPLYIESNQSFTLQITWPAVIATNSQQIGRIGERLRGYLIRQAT
jgi:hypothetical protein